MTDEIQVYTEFEQGSGEWDDARRGMVTASIMGRLVTPKTLKIATNDTSRAITLQLAAERITNHTDDTFASFDMEMGHVNEPIARDLYRKHFASVEEVSFVVRTQQGVKVGYSPDGLVGEDGLIEVKSRRPKEHLATILSGQVPTENVAQCQTALWVTGRQWIDYVSYCGGMPLYVIRVQPDPDWQDAIFRAAAAFEGTYALVLDEYKKATAGFPATERLDYEMRF